MSKIGNAMMTMHGKLLSLANCLKSLWYEDAAGHLCDILEHCRKSINKSLKDNNCASRPFDDLIDMVGHYGTNTTPIDTNPE